MWSCSRHDTIITLHNNQIAGLYNVSCSRHETMIASWSDHIVGLYHVITLTTRNNVRIVQWSHYRIADVITDSFRPFNDHTPRCFVSWNEVATCGIVLSCGSECNGHISQCSRFLFLCVEVLSSRWCRLRCRFPLSVATREHLDECWLFPDFADIY